jgi:rsbT co-antagonist protein RsbR
MGASVIVTGLSAEVAQSLVALGIDLRGIHAVGDLQGGLEDAQRMLAR